MPSITPMMSVILRLEFWMPFMVSHHPANGRATLHWPHSEALTASTLA